jgi:hypothetical protein
MRLDLEKGKKLVRMAREAIEVYVCTGKSKNPEDEFNELREVFCTLKTYPEGELRGCVGLPYPDRPLSEAVLEAAISSTRDPRFPPFSLDELDKTTVELSVLTPPEEIKAPDRLSQIEKSRDGLILEYGCNQGLFLPQVWEELPTPEEFLSHLCYKAGLSDPNAWKDKEARLYRFQAQIFSEKEPRGEIEEKIS